MKEDDLKCCGSCCWFKHEDTDGFGVCYQRYPDHIPYCGDDPCDKYISNKEAHRRPHSGEQIQTRPSRPSDLSNATAC